MLVFILNKFFMQTIILFKLYFDTTKAWTVTEGAWLEPSPPVELPVSKFQWDGVTPCV